VRRIGLKLKAGKLDTLFLFIPTVLTIAFSIVQYLGGPAQEPKRMTAFIPLYVVGAGIPIYVGYYRGGIGDSNLERARGWIYLVSGTWLYAVVTAGAPYYRKPIQGSFYDLLFIAVFFIMMLPAFLISKRVGLGVLSLLGQTSTKQDVKVFQDTRNAAAMLAIAIGMMTNDLGRMMELGMRPWNLLSEVTSYIACLYFWTACEWSARGRFSEGEMTRDRFVKSMLSIILVLANIFVGFIGTLSEMYPSWSALSFGLAVGIATGLTLVAFLLLRETASRVQRQ